MPNDKVILICRMKINRDAATNYIYEWAEQIKTEAILLGYQVIDLINENFDEDKIKEIIDQYDPFLVFLNGHGTEYSIKGFDKKTDVILRCKNDHLFKNRIVYALSCSTGTILGRSALNKGCRCYIGFRDEVKFPTQEMYNSIMDDFVAEPFMRISNEIIFSFLRGDNPEEAIKNSQTLADELIAYWRKQEKREAPTIIKFLRSMKNNYIMHAV